MAIVARTATVVENVSTQTITGTIPADKVTGDLVVAVYAAYGTSGQLTPPSGWTALHTTTSTGATNTILATYYRFDPPSDPVFSTSAAASKHSVICQAFGGVDSSTPVDVSSVVTTATNNTGVVATGVTTVTNNAVLISAYSVDTSTRTVVVPSGMTTEAITSATGVGRGAGLATELRATAGASGTRQWFYSGSTVTLDQVAFVGALRPQSATTVTPAVIARSVVVPTPTITRGTTATPTTIARTVVMPASAPFVPDAIPKPSTIALAAVVPTPSITRTAVVTPATIARSVVIPTPPILIKLWGPLPEYRLQSRLRDGTYVADLPYRNLQFEMGWNRAFGIRFEVPSTHPAISPATLKPGLHEIWVWRNGSLITAGPLWDIVISSENSSISCNAMSLLDYFDVRLIDTVEYNVVEQTQIAWDLINDSQAHTGGDLHIIQGALSTGISRSAKWSSFDNKYVLEALIDFSEMDAGFDFTIDAATRTFIAQYPRPQRDLGLQLIYPYHIRRYSMQFQGKYLRNRIRVQATEPTFIEAVDTTSRTTYGLRDYADSYKDAATVTDLTAYASKLRDRRKDVWDYPSIVINTQVLDIFDPSVIRFGDIVNLVINDGYVQYNRDMRYTTAQISVDKQGVESVVIYLQDTRELG